MLGPWLTHWTIRFALACLAVSVGARWAGQSWARSAVGRGLWTLGCGLFLTHVAAAFHFYHHWSHAHAFEETARQTAALLGFRFGEGIYFSYLFTLLWLADVLWWWLSPATHARLPAAATAALLLFMSFIAFNGAVVFEDGVTRPVGLIVAVVVVALGGGSWLLRPPVNSTAASREEAPSP